MTTLTPAGAPDPRPPPVRRDGERIEVTTGVLLVVTTLTIVGALLFIGVQQSRNPLVLPAFKLAQAQPRDAPAAADPDLAEKEDGPLVAVDEILLRLPDATSSQVISLSLDIGVRTAAEKVRLEAEEGKIRNVIVSASASLSAKNLRGSAELNRTKQRLRERLQAALPDVEIRRVLLRELIASSDGSGADDDE